MLRVSNVYYTQTVNVFDIRRDVSTRKCNLTKSCLVSHVSMPSYGKLFLSRAFEVKCFKVSRKDDVFYVFDFVAKIGALN